MKKHPLFDAPCDVEEFNSNNAWGFGGAAGLRFDFRDDLYAKIAQACYRHAPAEKFIAVYHNGRRVYDALYSLKALAKANEIVNNIINPKNVQS